MGSASARGRRARVNSPGRGTVASRLAASIRGRVVTTTRASGHRESDTGLASRPRAAGSTRASGRKGSRDGMEYDTARPLEPSSREHGRQGYKTDTALRRMLMEVGTTVTSTTINNSININTTQPLCNTTTTTTTTKQHEHQHQAQSAPTPLTTKPTIRKPHHTLFKKFSPAVQISKQHSACIYYTAVSYKQGTSVIIAYVKGARDGEVAVVSLW